MAWTSPRTWVAGETVTAALLNTHVRDNLLELNSTASAWTGYTPTLTGFPATITLARYKQTGKTVFVEVFFTLTGAATASMSVTLPVTELAAIPLSGAAMLGMATALVGSAFYLGNCHRTSAGKFAFISSGSGSGWNAATPATWASGSTLGALLTYEAA